MSVSGLMSNKLNMLLNRLDVHHGAESGFGSYQIKEIERAVWNQVGVFRKACFTFPFGEPGCGAQVLPVISPFVVLV